MRLMVAGRQWWPQEPRNDASTIIGLQTGWAMVVSAVIVTGLSAVGVAAGGVRVPWLFGCALVILAACVAVLLLAPGTPMSQMATALVLFGPAVAVIVSLPALSSRPGLADGVTTGLGIIVASYLCARGRLWQGWLCFALVALVAVVASAIGPARQSLTAPIVPNIALMLMATFFCLVVRPRARQIYALRRQTERESAQSAAEAATAVVRDQQLARLDERARPLLAAIARGERLSDDFVAECGLVEARLRDGIRAPGLDAPELVDAVWAARARGVRVLLLDDRDAAGTEEGPSWLSDVRSAAVDCVQQAASTSRVTVRLLPPGRSLAATISVADELGTSRQEFAAVDRR